MKREWNKAADTNLMTAERLLDYFERQAREVNIIGNPILEAKMKKNVLIAMANLEAAKKELQSIQQMRAVSEEKHKDDDNFMKQVKVLQDSLTAAKRTREELMSKLLGAIEIENMLNEELRKIYDDHNKHQSSEDLLKIQLMARNLQEEASLVRAQSVPSEMVAMGLEAAPDSQRFGKKRRTHKKAKKVKSKKQRRARK